MGARLVPSSDILFAKGTGGFPAEWKEALAEAPASGLAGYFRRARSIAAMILAGN